MTFPRLRVWKDRGPNKKPMEDVLHRPLPNLFTLCGLADFRRAETSRSFYEDTLPLLQFWFCKCLIAGKPSGVLDTVGYAGRTSPWGIDLNGNSAVSVATFSQFKVLWRHHCGPTVREQAKSKVWSERPRSFPCPQARKNYTISGTKKQATHSA